MEDETIRKIVEAIDRLRPYLNAEGGDVEFVEFKDGYVYVKVSGACAECGYIDIDIAEGIEDLLVSTIPGIIGVKQI